MVKDALSSRRASEIGTVLFSILKGDVLPVLKRRAYRYAVELRDLIKQRIREQTFPPPGLAPLSLRYLQKKKRMGYSTKTLVASAEYLNSITVIKTPTGAKVGVKNKTHAPIRLNSNQAGIPMFRIAQWLEYGTKYMPARPVWRPAYLQLQHAKSRIEAEWTKEMQTITKKAFEQALKIGASGGKVIPPSQPRREWDSRDKPYTPRLYSVYGKPKSSSLEEFKKTGNVEDLRYPGSTSLANNELSDSEYDLWSKLRNDIWDETE